nr:hypothetical protein [Microvirga splendida]
MTARWCRWRSLLAKERDYETHELVHLLLINGWELADRQARGARAAVGVRLACQWMEAVDHQHLALADDIKDTPDGSTCNWSASHLIDQGAFRCLARSHEEGLSENRCGKSLDLVDHGLIRMIDVDRSRYPTAG